MLSMLIVQNVGDSGAVLFRGNPCLCGNSMVKPVDGEKDVCHTPPIEGQQQHTLDPINQQDGHSPIKRINSNDNGEMVLNMVLHGVVIDPLSPCSVDAHSTHVEVAACGGNGGLCEMVSGHTNVSCKCVHGDESGNTKESQSNKEPTTDECVCESHTEGH